MVRQDFASIHMPSSGLQKCWPSQLIDAVREVLIFLLCQNFKLIFVNLGCTIKSLTTKIFSVIRENWPSSAQNKWKNGSLCWASSNCWHFSQHQHVGWANVHALLLVHDSVWLLYHPSISGLNKYFPLIFVFIVHPCVGTYFLCLLFSDALPECAMVVSNA